MDNFTPDQIELIKKTAKEELEHDLFLEAVKEYKAKLKSYRPFWDKLFPFKIIFIRKERL